MNWKNYKTGRAFFQIKSSEIHLCFHCWHTKKLFKDEMCRNKNRCFLGLLALQAWKGWWVARPINERDGFLETKHQSVVCKSPWFACFASIKMSITFLITKIYIKKSLLWNHNDDQSILSLLTSQERPQGQDKLPWFIFNLNFIFWC